MMKRVMAFFAAVLVLLSICVGVLPPQARAQAPGVTTIADSTPANNTAEHYTLLEYRALAGDISWPLRTDCRPPFGSPLYKTLPWLPGDTSAGINGNNFTASGSCSEGNGDYDYHSEGGWASGAWLEPYVLGWADDGVNVTLPGPPYTTTNNTSVLCNGQLPCSSKLNSCSTSGINAPILWANRNQDDTDYSNAMFAANGLNVVDEDGDIVRNPDRLESHGVSIFRNNFNLTQTQLTAINAATFRLEAVADDWLRMYINGILVTEQTDSAVGITIDDIPANVKSALRVGQNNIAFQIIDKASWDEVARGAGFCYALRLDETTVRCTPDKLSARTGEPITFTGSGGNGSYGWSGGEIPPSNPNINPFVTSYSTAGSKNVTVTSGSSGTCTVTISVAGPPGAAEVFIYTPEMFFNSPFRSNAPYQSITNLPPVL